MSFELPTFRQPIGLFPLPNVVLLPGGTQPLQIHEPRYRSMIRDALREESLIAMALLRPGFEADYYTNQARIYPIVCVGRIREHVKVADGRYFINLVGLCRARISKEDRNGEYRQVAVVPMIPGYSAIAADGEYAARNILRKVVYSPEFDDLPRADICREVVNSEMPLSDLVDRLAAELLPRDAVEIRQHMLEELDVFRRTGTLLNELKILHEKRRLRLNRHGEDGRPRVSEN